MQLKASAKSSSILATAAAGLLGMSTLSAAEWEHEASVLYYGEDADRVQDASIKYGAKRTNDNGDNIGLNLGLDSLTGASPNGITPSNQAQTISSASGNSYITHPAGKLPLDDTFKDTRLSSSISWDRGLNDTTRSVIGASFSKEYDYLHLGLNAGLNRTFNNKNTTLSGGISFANDSVDAVGGIPAMLQTSGVKSGDDSDTKQVTEAIFGVTQIFSKRMIGQFNYGFSQADGYLNDPYKYVSLVDNNGTITDNLYESRPDSRTGHNLYASLKWKFGNKLTSTTGLRYHTDDWGIDSATIDQKLRIHLGNKRSIEPHIRYYQQNAADFYRVQLSSGETLPQFVSADYRLAEFDALTLGATYRWPGKNDKEWRVMAEYYQQNPTEQTLTAGQEGLDASPGFSAAMLSVGLKF